MVTENYLVFEYLFGLSDFVFFCLYDLLQYMSLINYNLCNDILLICIIHDTRQTQTNFVIFKIICVSLSIFSIDYIKILTVFILYTI